MRFTTRWLTVLVVLILLTATMVSAQKKPAGVDKDKDKEITSEKMIRAGVLVGKIRSISEEKRSVRLAVTVPVTRLDTGALQQMKQAQLDLIQARARGDRNAMVSATRSMAQAQATLYRVDRRTQDIELQVQDEVVVRTARPHEQFDDKGKPRRLTKAELKELKGPDPKVPGYKAEFGDLAVDQIVQVTLVKKKTAGPKVAAKPKPKTKEKEKDSEGEAPVDLLGDNLPQISMIMILMDPPPSEK